MKPVVTIMKSRKPVLIIAAIIMAVLSQLSQADRRCNNCNQLLTVDKNLMPECMHCGQFFWQSIFVALRWLEQNHSNAVAGLLTNNWVVSLTPYQYQPTAAGSSDQFTQLAGGHQVVSPEVLSQWLQGMSSSNMQLQQSLTQNNNALTLTAVTVLLSLNTEISEVAGDVVDSDAVDGACMSVSKEKAKPLITHFNDSVQIDFFLAFSYWLLRQNYKPHSNQEASMESVLPSASGGGLQNFMTSYSQLLASSNLESLTNLSTASGIDIQQELQTIPVEGGAVLFKTDNDALIGLVSVSHESYMIVVGNSYYQVTGEASVIEKLQEIVKEVDK